MTFLTLLIRFWRSISNIRITRLRFRDLLDEVVKHFDEETEDSYDEDTIRLSIIGRPNVGKSSLVNAILGEDRVIVSNVAGTTRDAVDTEYSYDGQDYVLIDTAGMRKKEKCTNQLKNIQYYVHLKQLSDLM